MTMHIREWASLATALHVPFVIASQDARGEKH
jgi:hypothetical protein